MPLQENEYEIVEVSNPTVIPNPLPVSGTVSISGTVPVSGTVAVSGTVPVSTVQTLPVKMGDSASLDAFSRIRVSNPVHLFDTNFVYDLQPLLLEAVVAESGASITHSSTKSCAVMAFSSTPTGGKAYLQSYEQFKYQSGRSHLIFLTHNFINTTANVLKFVGYGDRNNGIFLEQNGLVTQLRLYSTTGYGSETVAKADWNLDKLDGTGTSGITYDGTKTQILCIDLQWLGVGRVRVGFDIEGMIHYVHEFNHANLGTAPYMKTATLPISAGMTCTGTVTSTMDFICSSVISEGGDQDIDAVVLSQAVSVTAASGARTHALTIRPKLTFNSVPNRVNFRLTDIEVLVTGANPVKYELCVGDVLSGTTTFNDVNTTYSTTEYNTLGTTSGSPAIVIETGFVSASVQAKGSVSHSVASKYPITLDAAGAVRALGSITLLLTGIGGASACQVSLGWKEVR